MTMKKIIEVSLSNPGKFLERLNEETYLDSVGVFLLPMFVTSKKSFALSKSGDMLQVRYAKFPYSTIQRWRSNVFFVIEKKRNGGVVQIFKKTSLLFPAAFWATLITIGVCLLSIGKGQSNDALFQSLFLELLILNSWQANLMMSEKEIGFIVGLAYEISGK